LNSASSGGIVGPSAIEEEWNISNQTSSSSKLSAEDSEVFDLSSTLRDIFGACALATIEEERDITVKSKGVDSEAEVVDWNSCACDIATIICVMIL
jgi:hypothetical protein